MDDFGSADRSRAGEVNLEVDLELDPVLDPAYPRIGAMDPSLPLPPDHDHRPVKTEQPEPEDLGDVL